MLSLYKLKIFSIVAQAGSFSKAAKSLYLTQSAISQHICSLENKLGTQLFERKPTGVQLTPSGQTLLQYTQKILWLVSAAENAVTNVENLSEGQLKLGATPVAAIYLLPTWIKNFFNRYPALNTSLHTAITADIIQKIINGQLDLGFVEGELEPSTDFHSHVLQEITLYLVVNKNHPWSQREEISLQELNDARFVMRPLESHTRIWVNQLFKQHNIAPQIIAEFDDPEVIKHAVINGMGATILPICMIEKERAQKTLYAIPIQEFTLKRTLKLIWKANTLLSPISRAFLETLAPKYPMLNDLLQQTNPPPETF